MNSSTASTHRINGHWLLLARAIWITLTIISIVVFIFALSGTYTGWRKPCSALSLSPEELTNCINYAQALQQHGLSREFNSIYFMVGIMVYQMLTGKLPFKHNNPGTLLIAHLTQPPPDACRQVPDLPEKSCGAIQKAMAKKPDERFITASEIAIALNSIR